MENFNGSYPGLGFPRQGTTSGGGGPGFGRASLNEFPGGGAQPPSLPYANGIVSRPSGPREDSLGGSSRAQGGGNEVFMVREANGGRGGTGGGGDRSSSLFQSGGRIQVESDSGGGDRDYQREKPSLASTTSSTHHHREREKESLSRAPTTGGAASAVLPKMLKVAVVGESTAGKTAICNAFTSEGYNFSRNYHMTAGASVYAKSIKLPSSRPSGGREPSFESGGGGEDVEPRINLVLVDSAGKDIYRELLPHYWDRVDAIAVIIDLTSNTALDTAPDWVALAKGSSAHGPNKPTHHPPPDDGSGDQSRLKRDHQDGSTMCVGVLVGSKSDLKEERVISPKQAQDFALQHGLQYFECSAKENSGLEEPFFYLAHQWTTNQQHGSEKENYSDGGMFGGKSSTSSSSRKSAFASRQSSSEQL